MRWGRRIRTAFWVSRAIVIFHEFELNTVDKHHWTMLLGACAIVVLVFLLEVHADQRVAFRGLASYPLPETCMSHSLFGVDCPGCGLTRSLIHLAHGRWEESIRIHRIGWIMALAVILQIPYRTARILRPDNLPLGSRIPKWFGQALILLLITNWVLNVCS